MGVCVGRPSHGVNYLSAGRELDRCLGQLIYFRIGCGQCIIELIGVRLYKFTNSPDGRMSRASASRFGKSEHPNFMGSSPSRVKPMTYKIDTCHLLARCSALLG